MHTQNSLETNFNQSEGQQVFESERRHTKAETGSPKMMQVRCVKCGNLFESTFSVDDFHSLPSSFTDGGTLHLCPHCGHLGIYSLKDYVENKE
jgi:uncharacterized C2H2 Zn-finger protein